MISFLHPGFLYAASAAAAVVVALHFLVAEQPRAGMLPTVRFFPDVEVRSTTLTVRLSDLLLLLLRVLTLLLIGAAFAQPRLKPSRAAVMRILAIDESRGAALDAVGDSAAKYLPGAAVVVRFDSSAREISPKQAPLSTVREKSGGSKRGSISSALIVALRAASRERERADAIELILVSPFLAEEFDSATNSIRALWPGGIRLVRVPTAEEPTHLTRSATLEWADSAASPVWVKRALPDTIGGLATDSGVVVYPFQRKWRAAEITGDARVVARWVDGEPAIIEAASDSGCARSTSVPLPTRGDAILRTSFSRLLESLHAPCAALRSYALASDAELALLAGSARLAPTSAIPPVATRMTPLVPWLLGAALLLTLLELPLRRRGERDRSREEESAATAVTREQPAGKVA